MTQELSQEFHYTQVSSLVWFIIQLHIFSFSIFVSTEDSQEWQLELLKLFVTVQVSVSLNNALGCSEVSGILCRMGTEVPNEQKLLAEDSCTANEFVAAHITEITIIISSLAECLNKS